MELGIPTSLAQAARLACGIESKLDRIDVGEINGGEMEPCHFLLRMGIGFEATVMPRAGEH